MEVLRRCRLRGIHRVQVKTGEHPFFATARKMYLSCGLIESGRLPGGPHPDYGLIEYSKLIIRVDKQVSVARFHRHTNRDERDGGDEIFQ